MDKQRLTEILLEMRSGSLQVSMNPTEENIKNLMNKYDMLFLGKDVNCIRSIELAHSLKSKFGFEISIDDLNKALPAICTALNMKYEPLVNVADVPNPNPPLACYNVILW